MALSLPTNWVPNHTPTAAELEQVLVVARGVWTTYTPTWSGSVSNPTIGNGTITGSYAYLSANTVMALIRIDVGSTSTKGSGNYTFSLPVAAISSTANGANGTGLINDSGSALRAGISVVETTSTTLKIFLTATGSQFASASLLGTFSGSWIQATLVYQVA